ncbi:hypothetical protein MRX96_055245 [Rhipicephalus microplus]|uniref:Uncharacterized protein n=1 Tax=Rhipicephalus microplus TaxID=6941 RepID=A0A9J6DKM3_RHIMP|nr:hypothetical protein HPB51_001405 [Rhipicephalus microplus]
MCAEAGRVRRLPNCPNSCSQVVCKPFDASKCTGKKKIRHNAGPCQCCDRCVFQLQDGEVCKNAYLWGYEAPLAECVDGYRCDPDTGKCRRASEINWNPFANY